MAPNPRKSKGRPRPILEELPRIDAAAMHRAGLFTKGACWIDGICLSAGCKGIGVTYDGVVTPITVFEDTNPLTGRIRLLACPFCDGIHRILYHHDGGWRCRTCCNG